MRKIILALICSATIGLVSCKGNQEKSATESKGETTEEVQKSDVEVPGFDNEKLGEYIKLYDSYIEEYKEVVNTKDMTKFQGLATKGQELAAEGQKLVTSGLSESDAKKLQEYMNEKAKELQDLAQKMMK